MTALNTLLTTIAILTLLFMSIWRFLRNRRMQQLLFSLVALALLSIVLQLSFGFPMPIVEPTAKGASRNAIAVLSLYMFVVLGMVARVTYQHLSFPIASRAPFEWAGLVLPILVSPVVFIPMLGAFQSVELREFDSARMMLFLLAFEQGFFWRAMFEQRRLEVERT